MSKKFMLGLAAMAMLATAGANAADLVISEPVIAPEPGFDWTGAYVGADIGWGGGTEHDNQSSNGQNPFPSLTADTFDVSGLVAGLHAGYNQQFGNFVLGVEGDVQYSDISGSADFNYPGGFLPSMYAPEGTLELQAKWQASARVRAGIAADATLFYATAGVAVAGAELSTEGLNHDTTPATPFSGTDRQTHFGGTVGVGIEQAFTDNLIGRAELRYSKFGAEEYDTPLGPVNSEWDQTVGTVGLSYKF